MLAEIFGVALDRGPLVGMAFVFVTQFVFGLALYYGLSRLSYWWFFEKNWDRYFSDEKQHPNPDEIKKSQRLAVWGTFGNAILGAPFQYYVAKGQSKVYYNVGDHGWLYFVFSFLFFLAFTETFVYWAHRWLHHPLIYKYIHLKHHEYRKPTPWVSFAFHPLDSFAQAVPHYICAFILPVHISIYAGFVVFVMLWTFFIHDQVSWVRHPWINYTAHHTMHHTYNKYNFGQFLTFWDRLGGTYRDPMKETRHVLR